MIDFNPDLATVVLQNTAEAEASIIATVFGIYLNSKYKGPKFVGKCLGVGFLALVAFRIYKGLI